MRIALGVVVVAACSPSPTWMLTVDAGPTADAYCPSMYTYTPMTITGQSPKRSLDEFHYAYATFLGGCGEQYIVDFTTKSSSCDSADPVLELMILSPFNTNGSNAVTAQIAVDNAMTNNVTFDATQLDMPDANPPHIQGHFVSNDPAWTFDIAVDLVSQGSQGCL